jgi:hypothetical protein
MQASGLFIAAFLLNLLFGPEDGSDVPPKRRFTFTGLCGKQKSS